jgi:uncharacterized protein DUF3883
MLDELLKCSALGGKEELQFLMFDALPLAEQQEVSDLRKYCISNQFSIGRYFDSTLLLLEFVGILSVVDGMVSANNELFDPAVLQDRETYFEDGDFVENLLLALKRENCLADFIVPDAVKREPSSNLYYVKGGLIPIRFFGIRNLFISLGFFKPEATLSPNRLLISPAFSKLFESLVLDSLKQTIPPKRRRSLADLKKQLEKQELLGAEAEIFVVQFERERLEGHPDIQSIQRVSEEYVNAGYDIESFSDKDSVFLDRFIEVKSFAGDPIFYWSKGEIEVALELGEKYYLYLVDRDLVSKPGYAPRIFQNPHQIIIGSEYWTKEPETWKISARPMVTEMPDASG